MNCKRRLFLLSFAACLLGLSGVDVYSQKNDDSCAFRYVFKLKKTFYVKNIPDNTGKLPPAKAIGGASVSESGIKLDGKSGYVKIPQSETVHITPKGATFSAVVKFYDDGVKGSPESMDMIFFKKDEFLLGRQDKQLYFNFHDGKKWIAAVMAPVEVKCNAWTHIAATVVRIDDAAQGDVGYKITLFMNGEPVISKKNKDIAPQAGTNSIEIGKGWGGPWFFNGEIAEVSMFDRALTDGEVLDLSSKLVQSIVEAEEIKW